ncbi:MAG: histidine phosphotransferase family protein [Pseudomonadota bacterium]|nr:histidine phosphotransferase family protein [Pseudomonadota bacterium]
MGVEAVGPRARLHPEVLAGLNGAARGEGPGGRWAQARFVHAIVAAAGGEVGARTGEAGITFWATLP